MNATAKYVLLATVILASACSGGGSPRDSELSASEHSALLASSTLSAALSGRVVEPANSLIAAATTGNVEVGDDGAATYRVPVWVPDGVNGLQPALSIAYDSGGRIGTLGPKWRLNGLSVILRCPQTLAQDGIERPFGVDSFCLDGERLRRQSGTANQIGDFRTERNPFQRVVATAQDAGGVATFQVYQPDGRIFYYGRTPGSRVVFTSGPNTFTYAYYLDKIQDRFGNSILISYMSHASQFNLTGMYAQALFPSAIQWGGTYDTPGQRLVTFLYQPPSYKPFAHQRRIAGNVLVGGEHLQTISVYGPDGFGNSPMLKQYKFGYTTPSITGEQLLTSIQECDGLNVCKRPTTMTWEPGSTNYTRTDLTTTQGITDIPMSNAPTLTPGNGGSFAMPNIYRRLMAVDLNRDGRDDLVYRVWTTTCTSWVARLATASGTYGPPIALPGASDVDPGCPGGDHPGTSTSYPYTGDIVFADLDQNGYPDVIAAHGNNGGPRTTYGPYTPQINGYFAYLNNSSAPLAYSTTRLSADALGVTRADNALLAIGDVNGDGYPDIIRPGFTSVTDGGVYWFSTRFPTVSQNFIPSSVSSGLEDLAAVDADGDGISEVFRLVYNGTNSATEEVTSPTLNVTGPNAPQPDLLPMTDRQMYGMRAYGLAAQRWTADFNGDGLTDYLSVSNTYPATQIYTGIATGARTQYVMPYTGTVTNLPTASDEIGGGWQDGLDDGVRITDFNLDGRDDVVLMGNGANASGPQRSHVVVLLSDGAGGFTSFTTSIPIGDPSDGGRAATGGALKVPGARGYRTSVSLDTNGDGLPDFVQLEGGHVISYVRQGKMPDMVTQIIEGTGRRADITYAPLGDTTTYTTDGSCATANAHMGCLVRGQWITKQVADTSLERPNASQTTTQTYSYSDGQYDQNGGRGFLGFLRRDIFGPGSRHVVVSTSPGFMTLGAGYIYPTALLPATVRTDTDTPQGPNAHHYDAKSVSYGNIYTSGANNTSVTVLPNSESEASYDCAPNGAGGCSGASRLLSQTVTTPGFDIYGNLTSRTVAHVNSSGATTQLDTDTITYKPADTVNWLVRLLSKKVSSSTNYSETVTRTTNYVTSSMTQTLYSTETEPTGDNTTHLLRTYGRDGRGRLTSVADNAFPSQASCNTSCGNSCSASCNTNCAGSSNVGACLSGCMAGCVGGCTSHCEQTPNEVRTTGYQYEDADGVYVTTTTNPLLQSSRQWRHPGYGFLVEEDDPNHLARVRTYDTFGRTVLNIEMSGAKSAFAYADTENPASSGIGGVDYAVVPDDTATATQTIHLDSLGREVFRTVPVDSARAVTTWNDYDTFGRLRSKMIVTGTPAVPITTVQNSYTTTFDDLDRSISECHLAADGSNHCKTNMFDGLTVASTDESGHTVVRTVDSQGRASTETANAIPVATFGYGPFGQLESESVSSTTIGYDVLGRQVALTRFTPGIRKTVYDAYGEVVGSYKQKSDGTQAESVAYSRDKLGRLTGVVTLIGSGISRSFYYDQSPYGGGGTNTIGKLIDAFDQTNQIHFDYGANGLLMDEKWMIGLFGASQRSFGSMTYSYDAYGRVSSVTYPQNIPGGNYTPFSLAYGYDPYVGDVSSLTNNGNAVWSITNRNALGEATAETMKSAGGTTINGSATYSMPTGQLSTRSLQGPSTQVSESYSYYPNALPRTFQVTAPTGSYAESYGYDSINRLSSWTAASGAPTVSYSYDWNGNLAQRSWSGETVTYSSQTGSWGPFTMARVTNVAHNGVTVETDTYVQDAWGRVYQAPTSWLGFDVLDELVGATDQTTGNSDVGFIRDALGERVATTYTTYGPNASNSYLITLMKDAYELKYNGATNTYEERCRIRANGRVIGDVVKRASTSPSATTFYLTNNVGSVVAEVSDSGTVTARGQRDPYGNAIANPMSPNLPPEPQGANPDGTSRLGFGDHERETGIGLVDMNARFYSPRLGGFVSPDSLIANKTDGRDYFPYAYAGGNPVAFTDPTGHDFGGPDAGYYPGAAAAARAGVNAGAAADAIGADAAAMTAGNSGSGAIGGEPISGGEDDPASRDPASDSSASQVMTPANASRSTQASTDATGATVYEEAGSDGLFDSKGNAIGYKDAGGNAHIYETIIKTSAYLDGGPRSGEMGSSTTNYLTEQGYPVYVPMSDAGARRLVNDNDIPLYLRSAWMNRRQRASSTLAPSDGDTIASAVEYLLSGFQDAVVGASSLAAAKAGVVGAALSFFGFNPLGFLSPASDPAPNFSDAKTGFDVHVGN